MLYSSLNLSLNLHLSTCRWMFFPLSQMTTNSINWFTVLLIEMFVEKLFLCVCVSHGNKLVAWWCPWRLHVNYFIVLRINSIIFSFNLILFYAFVLRPCHSYIFKYGFHLVSSFHFSNWKLRGIFLLLSLIFCKKIKIIYSKCQEPREAI